MARPSLLAILPVALAGSLVGLFLWGMTRENPDDIPTALAGRQAPAVAEAALGDLPPFAGADLRAGGVTVVNFWASWCAPCRAEHPNLKRLADEGVPVYGVNYKDRPEAALRFLDELGNPYAAVVTDEAGRMGIEWGLYGVPETFVIAADGTVILRFTGPITERSLQSDIRPALVKAAGG
jgi:cytochrome c biogenesis protein CcmG/thiol:disulfide interchange protein DsbE